MSFTSREPLPGVYHIEDGMDAAALREEGHDPNMVETVLRAITANEYKRRFEPVAPNVVGRSFPDRDWPITNAWKDRS